MKINLLSSFAAGMLITTTICGAVYLSGKSDSANVTVKPSVTTATKKVQPTSVEMKAQLQEEGYVVQTKAENDKQVQDAKASVQAKAAPAAADTAKPVTRVVVNVTDGMTSIDIGRVLVASNIVKNAFDFSKDIEAKKLENKLKPGVFVVDSKMTYDQVVATIFK
ncbi:endolytic transglycosylase MltG [Neobacillus drentensis]|uniref:endolytic transglycosylase MltG n=1 Tax=Neobacillus drentensis TaxID=220684 RepID=UPI001F3AEAD3|nr:endolytic transglycosylase MltG [Neobacillus drentensis]ULT54754.1 endolytic transglycosylase MltG [Neobacillus drentensis]